MHALTVLRGGTVVTPEGVRRADVELREGRIARIDEAIEAPGADVVEVGGRYVIPGGVDPHTHLDTVFRDQRTADDFSDGTAAALAGGTTTLIDFCIQPRGVRVGEALERWHARLDVHRPACDIGCHFAVTDLTVPGALADLAALPDRGIPSFKTYMAYPGRTMLEDDGQRQVLDVAARTGATVLVHAEDGHAIEALIARALAAGQVAPRFHARTRPPETEAAAIARIAELAERAGAALYVVHVSSALGVEALVAARERGAAVRGETCPQYLLLDESALDGPVEEAAKFVFTPPPRTAGDRARLWRALADDELAVVSTDHCPFDADGQKRTVEGGDFTTILNGAPGVEQRLVLLHEHGVRRGRISLERWVELCATAPARAFGLAGRKGELTVGADADVVVFDPERRWTITAAAQRSRVDYSPYEGTTVTGTVERVYRGGRLAVDGGRVLAAPGDGAFLPRERPGAGR
ncbi:dihydropyrimidinase [Patulibacter defluvii]|uniref:dihydropyrimidinase n=1 Tax=Patulibacter defluvii TaxID=3095358 RepID=UPI002A755CC1|nr:dihydropyrimidinase [Patulibacter sp. DM4]